MSPAVRVAATLVRPITRTADVVTRANRLTLVGWHRIGDARDGLTTTMADFQRHLDVLAGWGATVLPLDEACGLLADGRLPERAVALTFDDGYASVLERAWPELQARGLPATLFAVSGRLGPGARFPWDAAHPRGSDLVRLATAGELRAAVASGLDVGSHTVTHRWLPSLSRAEVTDEVTRSRRDLEDLLGREITSFAYPMGGWTPAIRDQVATAGYRVAITCDRGRNRRGQDAIALRRAFAADRPDDVRRQLDGAYTWLRPLDSRRYRREPRWA